MRKNSDNFDVIVAGGGHAGCEAALASARTGARTLLLSINLDHIAQMSCNPAVGGVAKGHVVREIDALGGAQARITEAAMLQFRMLNRAKGPAVWSPRAQCDKVCYQKAMKRELELQENLFIRQGIVEEFIVENEKLAGVVAFPGGRVLAKSVVVASGTFLNGVLHYGLTHVPGGRAGDPPSTKLSESLSGRLGLRLGRLKTGTPPRLLAKTIDFEKMGRQESEVSDEYFCFFPGGRKGPEVSGRNMPCFMVYTTDETALAVRENLDKAPMYQGKIKGIGTRYCPSFEDKVVRFPHHEKHLLYLEPEGEHTDEYYLNGMPTSLPPEVQERMTRSVPGLENAMMSRHAYAIEYDFVFPDQLERSLVTKRWRNLFLAGQINGTSGYEEAAGQGLVAGLNAARHAKGLDLVELARDMCYIGVMIDDLVTKDIVEPYRLFTSRAEHRLRLRQDNADLRLCDFAHENGILPDEKHKQFVKYREALESCEILCKSARHQGKTIWEHLKDFGGEPPKAPLPFPLEMTGTDQAGKDGARILRQLVIRAHYEGYLRREDIAVAKLRGLEEWRIPEGFDYKSISGLKNESRAKLEKVAPTTLAQAGRIDGVTPAELALLQVFLMRRGGGKKRRAENPPEA